MSLCFCYGIYSLERTLKYALESILTLHNVIIVDSNNAGEFLSFQDCGGFEEAKEGSKVTLKYPNGEFEQD